MLVSKRLLPRNPAVSLKTRTSQAYSNGRTTEILQNVLLIFDACNKVPEFGLLIRQVCVIIESVMA
jgi:hypothetical protein